MPPRFFITHSWQDVQFARQLCDDLRAHGLDGFFDAYSIQPGDDIAVRIAKGLEECEIYMPLLSPVAVASKWCELEISTAINLSVEPGRGGRPRIIPILVQSCQVPTLLRGKLHINFEGHYDDAFRELLTKGLGLPASPMAYEPRPGPEAAPATGFKPRARMWRAGVAVVLVAIVLMVLLAIGSFKLGLGQPAQTAKTTADSTAPSTLTAIPVVSSSTAAPMPSSNSPFQIGSTKTSRDGALMVFIPAGEFLMGSRDADGYISASEKPQHTVYVDAFWMGKFEVTNALYKKCVDAGRCSVPASWANGVISPGKEDHPVVGVSWKDAATYAEWTGGRLPREAEWEKAACWDEAKKARRLYPWGNVFNSQKANTSESGIRDTTPVGKYSPQGDSPYGVGDMAGNVWEWVADWYGETYYASSPGNNPKGVDTGQRRVLRGGAWSYDPVDARCAYRYREDPDWRLPAIGFRVAISATP